MENCCKIVWFYFLGLKSVLSPIDHFTLAGVGQYKTHELSLHGFYTSKTRQLKIKISSTLYNGMPLLAIQNISVSWTHCGSFVNISQATYTSSSSKKFVNIGWNSTFMDVLEDIRLSIVYRVS